MIVVRRCLVVFDVADPERNHIDPGDEREKVEEKRIERLRFEGGFVQKFVGRRPAHEMRERSMKK